MAISRNKVKRKVDSFFDENSNSNVVMNCWSFVGYNDSQMCDLKDSLVDVLVESDYDSETLDQTINGVLVEFEKFRI